MAWTSHWSTAASGPPVRWDNCGTHLYSCYGDMRLPNLELGGAGARKWPAALPRQGCSSCYGVLVSPTFPPSYSNFPDAPGLGTGGSGSRKGSRVASLCPAAVLKLCLPASKDPAWPGTTAKEGRPAPPPRGALPSPSTDPAPLATTVHREHCALCPVPGVRWGAVQVSLCPAPPPLPAGGPSFCKIQPQSLGNDTSIMARPPVGRASGAPNGVDTSGCGPCPTPGSTQYAPRAAGRRGRGAPCAQPRPGTG